MTTFGQGVGIGEFNREGGRACSDLNSGQPLKRSEIRNARDKWCWSLDPIGIFMVNWSSSILDEKLLNVYALGNKCR